MNVFIAEQAGFSAIMSSLKMEDNNELVEDICKNGGK